MPAGPPRSPRAMAALHVPGVPHHARSAPPSGRHPARAVSAAAETERRPGCSGRPAAVIPIRPPSGVPSPAGPTSTAPWPPPRSTGSRPLLWRAFGAADARDALGPDRAALCGLADAFRMEALLLIPRAVALAVRPLTGRRPRTGGLQGARRGGPLPRARAAPDGGHRPPAPPPPITSARSHVLRRGRLAGGAPRWRRPLRHRAGPRRGARRWSSSCTTGSRARRSG